ncbi:MAG TPA: metallophosphoesterase family protein [Solirubrobacterales bacterium]|nr:metallophosphoesterase family protein [Solirubrobacterales bacterium]
MTTSRDSSVAVIADTHMPKGGRRLPPSCVEALLNAKATIHAGDFSDVSVLAAIESLCPTVHAVHGNVDSPTLRRRLPEVLRVRFGEKTVAVVHDAGPARGRLRRLRARFPDADAVVFAHSHLPFHERDGDFQIFNPGSPTERRRAPRRSMGLLRCAAGELAFEHIWLDGPTPAAHA